MNASRMDHGDQPPNTDFIRSVWSQHERIRTDMGWDRMIRSFGYGIAEKWCTMYRLAGVAELADARDLGSRGRKALQVRFLSPALLQINIRFVFGMCLALEIEPSGNMDRIGLQRQPKGKSDAIGGTLVVMLAGCGMNKS